MLTYTELIALRDKLANGEIGFESAQAEYWKDFKEGQKSWNTKDWKERRAKIIKNKCEICSSAETLTLQHRSHPRKYVDYVREVTRKYTEDYINANPKLDKAIFTKYILAHYDHVAVALCPKCSYNNPYQRVRKLPEYRCLNCKHEFDEPLYKTADELISIFLDNEDAMIVRDKCFISKDKWKNYHNLSNIKYWLLRNQAKNNDAEMIGKEALLQYLDDCIGYLSFKDTLTACKKCAFNYDVKKMELCPKCNDFYKGFQYPTCIQCLPEDKRKAALASIEFGKQWGQMHEDLGID